MRKIKKNKIDFRLEAKKQGNKTKVYLYGDIVDETPRHWWTGEIIEGQYITPDGVRDLIDEIEDKNIDLHINSYGGSVFASVSIFNYLNSLDKNLTIFIDGLAASGASLIAMAGNKLIMPPNSMLMIHRASTHGFGNCEDLRKVADTLEKLDKSIVLETYKHRFNGSEEDLEKLIKNETWINAREALNFGLCDEVLEIKLDKEEKIEEIKEDEIKNGINFMYNFARLKF